MYAGEDNAGTKIYVGELVKDPVQKTSGVWVRKVFSEDGKKHLFRFFHIHGIRHEAKDAIRLSLMYSEELHMFDCAKKLSKSHFTPSSTRIYASAYYGADGAKLFETFAHTEWTDIAPGSLSQNLFLHVCHGNERQ